MVSGASATYPVEELPITKPIGRVPSWCSRENMPNMLKSGVKFQPRDPVIALRLSCWVKYWAPSTPETNDPATALLSAVEMALTVGVTLQVPFALTPPHSVPNREDCKAGLTLH